MISLIRLQQLLSFIFQTLRQLKKEYKAVQSMFVRSGLSTHNMPKINHRFLSTTSSTFNQNDPNAPKDPNQDKDKKKQDQEKMRTFVLKLSLLTMVAYTFVIYGLYLYFGQPTANPSEEKGVN